MSSRGCMVSLATVGSDGHDALVGLTRQLRTDGFEMIRARLAEAVAVGELPAALDVIRLARFLQTVQSGMAIRARDGAEQSELEDVAELVMRGWDAMILHCTGPAGAGLQE